MRFDQRPFVLAVAVAVASACGADGIIMPDHEPLVEIPLPPPVGEASYRTELDAFQPAVLWSADGGTIYHRSNYQGPIGIRAIDLQTNATRTLVTDADSYDVLRITDDGSFLLYSAPRLGAHGIYRLAMAGGAPELLVTGAHHQFGISPDGRMLAWQTATDSLFVRDLTTGETRSLNGVGFAPLAISPDHSQLMHGNDYHMLATTIATGAVTDLRQTGTAYHDVRWGRQGLEVLITNAIGIGILRGGSLGTIYVWTSPLPIFDNIDGATWSPDGTRIVAIIGGGICVSDCLRRLIVINVATGAVRDLATARDYIGKARFTSDGRRVAVGVNQRLHIVPLP